MSSLLRHQMIERFAAPSAEKGDDAAITLWEQLSTKIISIIGAGGFQSLYARSQFVAQVCFPWLAADEFPIQTDQILAHLKKCFESQTPVEASAANKQLLITLTNILASLIGETLTTSILRSAWDSDASVQAGKDFRNE